MKVITTISEMLSTRSDVADSIGLVPTMGYLHEGHLSLVRRARSENKIVIVTIFVNPSQFGPEEDLDSYPRDLSRDRNLLRAEGVDMVFVPSPDELYPSGYQTWIELVELSGVLEGARRPGHFRGVATIVAKLFNLTRPSRAYFGQKDSQQAILLRRLISDLHFDIDLVICPTIREGHGLAMSSRNSYLTANERERAAVLFEALTTAGTTYKAGERDASKLRALISDKLAAEPVAHPEYVSIADLETLHEIEGQISAPVLVSIAVQVGGARLIDNVWLGVHVG